MTSEVESAKTCCETPAPTLPARSTARKATVVETPSERGARTPRKVAPSQRSRASEQLQLQGVQPPERWQAACAHRGSKPEPVSTSMCETPTQGPPAPGASVEARVRKK